MGKLTGRTLVLLGIAALGACGGESPGSSAGPGEDAGLESQARPLATSKLAVASLTQVRARFAQTLPSGAAIRLDAADGWILPRFPDAPEGAARRAARIRLPQSASQPFELRDETSHVGLAVSMIDVAPVEGEAADGYVVYRGAYRAGADVLHRPTPTGTEDFVFLKEAPARASLEYDVALGDDVAGLRLIGRVLEFLDGDGTPRLRVAPPYVVDALGTPHEAALAVEGCKTDTDPAPPWGRPTVDPGAKNCRVRVSWGDLTYPAVVDPVWQTTGSLSTTRAYHTATLLDNGKVLIAGGLDFSATGFADKTCELYDPSSGTFGATGAMTNARFFHTATKIGSNVLVAGGSTVGSGSASLNNSEIYNAGTGTWGTSRTMNVKRNLHRAALLSTGNVLVTGGNNDYNGTTYWKSTEIYNVSTNAWSLGPNMAAERSEHSATPVGGGTSVLVVGGTTGGASLTSAELYRVSTNSWSSVPGSIYVGAGHTATLMQDGKVLVAGGNTGSTDTTVAYLYNPSTNAFAAAGTLATGRYRHAAALLFDGTVLQAGGRNGTTTIGTAEIFLGSTSWSGGLPMNAKRYAFTLTALPNGDALAAGGYDVTPLSDAELYAYRPDGKACTVTAQCASGHCVAGLCCDQACTGLCQACSAAEKGYGADGACEPVKAGIDPQGDCPDDGVASCDRNGACDGAGACQLYGSGTVCGSSSCTSGTQTGYACNGLGTCASSTTPCSPYVCATASACGNSCNSNSDCIASDWCDTGTHKCVADKGNGTSCGGSGECISGHCIDGVCCDQACGGLCQSCVAAATGGSDGACAPVLVGMDPDGNCPDDGASSCDRDGACDGAGACQLYAQGTACGSTTCSGGTQNGYTCDGFGTCTASSSSACTPYKCAGTACGTGCASDNDCVGGAYCASNHTCKLDQANGQSCTGASQCTSGHCADGVCCDQACGGTCQACTAALTGGANGSCAPASGGTDPHNDCAAQSADTCGRTGECSGLGACQLYTNGTACGSTTCSNGTQTGYACDGSGTCVAAQTTACGNYLCSGISCGTACSTDGDCVIGAYCNSSGKCATDQTNGKGCTSASQCVSGNCTDGVCCDQACDGVCQACSAAKKGQGTDGTCGPVVTGADPDNDCSAEAPASCGQDGNCDGAGACKKYGTTTVCGATTCSDSVTSTGHLCDGFGLCVDGTSTGCTPYKCSSGACGTTCATDTDCVSTHYCAGGTCVQKKVLGEACSNVQECASNFCVDGVCCDTACNGLCQACSASTKQSGTGDGTCDAAAAGNDPHNDCPDDGAPSCDRNGSCDGAGACAIYAAGDPCGQTSCVNNAVTGYICDGQGTCAANGSTDCDLYRCGGTPAACAASCAADSDCSDTAYCGTSGACVAKDTNGTSCTETRTCASGLCVDGVCCDKACSGQCEACDVATALGTCSPVSGAPHGARDACPGATNGDPCTARTCDGSTSTTTCAGYVGVDVKCREQSCSGGTEISEATCDGTGECPPEKTHTCEPFTCGAAACLATCTADADCVGGTRCENGKCVSGATCDDHIVTGADGTTTDCTPYLCEASGNCMTSCTNTTDCVTGYLCGDGVCVATSDGGGASDTGGCGCRAAGTGTREAPLGAGLMLLGLVALRRRRARGSRRARG